MKLIRSLAPFALLAVTGACYTYRPVTTTPRVTERVRLTLTAEGTTELARFLGPRVVVAEGMLSSIAADSAYVVAVDFVQMTDGVRQPWSGEGLVRFPIHYVREVRERVLLRRQSYVAGAALTSGLIAAAVFALRNTGSGGDGGGGPPPPPP